MEREGLATLTRWGANFDGVDVEPFLRHLASHIESGFGEAEARAAARKVRWLWFGRKLRASYDIRVAGSPAKLKLRASKDDVDSFVITFEAPAFLCEVMANERKRIEQELIADTTLGEMGTNRLAHSPLWAGAAMWLYRLLTFFRRGRGQ